MFKKNWKISKLFPTFSNVFQQFSNKSQKSKNVPTESKIFPQIMKFLREMPFHKALNPYHIYIYYVNKISKTNFYRYVFSSKLCLDAIIIYSCLKKWSLVKFCICIQILRSIGSNLAQSIPKLMFNFKNLVSNLPCVDLWTLELTMSDLKIGFSVKFPPRGLILRIQFWNLGPKIQKHFLKNAERLAK